MLIEFSKNPLQGLGLVHMDVEDSLGHFFSLFLECLLGKRGLMINMIYMQETPFSFDLVI